MKPLNEAKQVMKIDHQNERKRLDARQKMRFEAEQRERSARVRKGAAGVWDILTGKYFKTRKQNEMEAFFGLQRDRAQRHDLIRAQLKDRQALQSQIVQQRERHVRQLLGLYRDSANYRRMMRGEQYDRDGSDRARVQDQRQISAKPYGLELS